MRTPRTISGFSSAAKKDPLKVAKNVIRDNTGVGTDIRASKPALPPPPPGGFLKPPGFDVPASKAVVGPASASNSAAPPSGSGSAERKIGDASGDVRAKRQRDGDEAVKKRDRKRKSQA
jgi:hypothetical protein